MHKNKKKECEKFGERKIRPIFATHSGGKPDEGSEEIWEFSSVGLEHLPYKQRVGGSTPSTPTRRSQEIVTVFLCPSWCYRVTRTIPRPFLRTTGYNKRRNRVIAAFVDS